jgi:hypothetical protein
MKTYNHSPKTIAYSDTPFPAIRYCGGPRPTLLIPIGSKKLVDETGTLSEAIRLESCTKGGFTVVPSKKPAPGALHLARHSGGQVEVIEGAEHIFAEARAERPDGSCTELVFAAHLRGEQQLVVRVKNRVSDPDGALFVYTTAGVTKTAFHEAQPPAEAPVAAVPAPGGARIAARIPLPHLIPVCDGPLGYAHVITLDDGRPVWVAMAGLTYAVGDNPYQADAVDAGALGELLPGRPAHMAPAAFALAVTSAAAQRHAAEA